MFEERDALVLEVRSFDVHGAGFVDVTVAYADRSVSSARLGRESVPPDLKAGDRIVVRLVMNTIVEVTRPATDPEGQSLGPSPRTS